MELPNLNDGGYLGDVIGDILGSYYVGILEKQVESTGMIGDILGLYYIGIKEKNMETTVLGLRVEGDPYLAVQGLAGITAQVQM